MEAAIMTNVRRFALVEYRGTVLDMRLLDACNQVQHQSGLGGVWDHFFLSTLLMVFDGTAWQCPRVGSSVQYLLPWSPMATRCRDAKRMVGVLEATGRKTSP
jgi:hypothetical protein